LDLLHTQPDLRVPEIAASMGVSEGTVRNDLNALEEEGRLRRVHGGAILNSDDQFKNNSFLRRYELNVEAKLAIAHKAVNLVNDGDSILLDASSTGYYFARQLRERQNLRVVTNGFEVARELAQNPSNNVILIGGVVNNNASSVSGLLSERIIEDLHIQKAFLSCSGFSLERGMTEIYFDEAQLKRKIIESTDYLYALVDSSKFGVEDMTSFARREKIMTLFTDSGVTEEWKEKFVQVGINLVICDI